MDICVEQDIKMLSDKKCAFVFVRNVCGYLRRTLEYIIDQFKELSSGKED